LGNRRKKKMQRYQVPGGEDFRVWHHEEVEKWVVNKVVWMGGYQGVDELEVFRGHEMGLV
jgi:trehalose utilization protein